MAVPEADALVGDLRLAHDPAARAGVPSHVTVLLPFVPRAGIVEALRSRLREAFAQAAPFDYRFERVDRFGETTVYLAPERPEDFTRLTDLVSTRWPEHQPYGGAFAEVIPHLTVGDRLPPGDAAGVESETTERVRRVGPVAGRAAAVLLLVADEAGRFSLDSAYPLGGR